MFRVGWDWFFSRCGHKVHVRLDSSMWQCWESFSSQSFIRQCVAIGIFSSALLVKKKKLHWPSLACSQLVFFMSPKKVALDMISSNVMNSSSPRRSSLLTRAFSWFTSYVANVFSPFLYHSFFGFSYILWICILSTFSVCLVAVVSDLDCWMPLLKRG